MEKSYRRVLVDECKKIINSADELKEKYLVLRMNKKINEEQRWMKKICNNTFTIVGMVVPVWKGANCTLATL